MPSTTLTGDFVGTMRESTKPLFEQLLKLAGGAFKPAGHDHHEQVGKLAEGRFVPFGQHLIEITSE